ncbi:hypothetical protein [Phreatobacter cathodiphilus]|uniref:Uncharacterized protein n=1 Tax=Phreatobacter cathodiphilus TaxID=1868589 RepID=A0A2S0N7W0_9HYPH|nr:hypothetical protein [Phreatobacter cathodiphilus]AVO44242.1 hypothetical protein C6569_03685 [Phreatobacter cathodiphilus]
MMHFPAPLRLSAVLLLAMGSQALAGPADDLSRAAVGAMPSLQMGGAAIGEARDEGGNAVLVNVTFSSTGAVPIGVRIGRATITGAPGADGALSNARVLLEDVEGTGADGQGYKLARAEFQGAQGSLAAILGNLATQAPLVQPANEGTATGFSAQAIAGRDLVVTQARQNRQQTVRYGEIALTGYERGRVAELVVRTTQAAPTDGQPGPAASAASIRLNGLDMAAAVRASGPVGVWMESGVVEGISIASPRPGAPPFAIARIAMGKVSLRPGTQSIAALTESMQALGPAEDDAARRRQAGLAAEFIERFDMERFEIAGISGQSPEGLPFRIERFVFSGLSQGRLASVAMSGVSAASREGQDTTIGQISVEGIDASGLLALGKDYAAGRFAPGQTMPPQAYPHVARIVLEEVDVKQRGTSQQLAKVGRFEVESGPRVGLMPSRLRAKLTGFEAPITNARQRAQLAPLGLTDSISLGAELEIDYVEGAKELRMRTFNVEVDDVGSLNLVMTVGGLDRGQIEALPGSAAVLGLSAKAGAITLTYTEDGGVANFISHLAGQTGMSEDDFKEQIKTQAQAMVGQFIQDRAVAEQIVEAFGEFLDDPTSLAVTLTPKGDIPLAALAVALRGSPFAAMPMFNIAVKANE